MPGSAADLSGAIRYNRDVYHAWGRLREMVQTGKPVERPQLHLGEDEERTRTFVLAMHYRGLGIGRAVVGEPAARISAVDIAHDDLFDDRTEVAVLLLKTALVVHQKA